MNTSVAPLSRTADGSRVNVRSVSRLGLSDVGTKATRIEQFPERLKEPD